MKKWIALAAVIIIIIALSIYAIVDNGDDTSVIQVAGRETVEGEPTPVEGAAGTETEGRATAAAPQTWYLSDVSGGSRIMYKEDTSKPEGTVAISNGSLEIWKADEMAQVDVTFPAGLWSGEINLVAVFNDSFTAAVGSYDDATFSSAGSQQITGDGGTAYTLSISVDPSFTVPTGDYLALQISPSGSDIEVKTGQAHSYITSPNTDPGYPVPELPTIVLLAMGLLAFGGYFWFVKPRKLIHQVG